MLNKKDQTMGMLIIGVLFFIFGFITWVNGSLIPYLKIACQLTDQQSYYVASAFFAAYFVMAIPSSYILKATGFKKGMSIGLFIMAIGAFLFIPAAQSRNYSLFLAGLFIIGTGLTLLQTASNPYVSILGPIESAARRISIMGICNKLAGQIAILAFGFIVLKDSDKLSKSLLQMSEIQKNEVLNSLAQRVVVPYTLIGIALLVLAVGILYSKLPNIDAELEKPSENQTDRASILNYPYAIFGALAIFMYVGVEVVAGDTIASYGKAIGISLDVSKYFPMLTLFFMFGGYLFGIAAIPKLISQQNALLGSAILGILFSVCILFTSGTTSVIFVALLGLANSVMWPAIFPLGIDKLGRHTKMGSALLIMGIIGGAVLPPLYGYLQKGIDTTNLSAVSHAARNAYWILIPAYLYIFWFGLKGHKIGK